MGGACNTSARKGKGIWNSSQLRVDPCVFMEMWKQKIAAPVLSARRTGPCFVFRPARTINSKTAVRPQPDRTRHFDKARKPPREARTARRFVSQSPDALSDSLAVAIQAGHDSDAAISEEVRRRKIRPCQHVKMAR